MADEEQLERSSCLALDGKNVCFKFGKQTVLADLDISVEKSVIYGLLGPSGCGKTTLLRCIVGRHKPSSGSIKIYGKKPGQRGFCVPGHGVGYMPQELALHSEITTEETLTYFGRVYQMSEKDIKERITFLTEFLDIPDKKKLIKKLSGGQQRRVSFAAALIHKPPLVILDEPTVGVDPLLRKNIWDYLQKLAKDDFATIIITTHYVEEARQAHVVGLMRGGRLLAEANPEHLINKFNALTLEDVFLNLCVKDTHTPETREKSSLFEASYRINHGSGEDVWIYRKQKRNSNYLQTRIQNGSEHKDVLLKDALDPESVLTPNPSIVSMVKRSLTRLGALTKKNFIREKRNLPLLFFQLFIPTFQVIVFCLCVGGEPFDLPLAIVNMETDPKGKGSYFIEHISPKIIRQVHFSNFTPAVESVRRGENWGVLHIGPNFTQNLVNRFTDGFNADLETIEASTIKLHLDMTNQQIAITIYAKIMEGFQLFARSILEESFIDPVLADPPVVLEKPIYGHEKPDFTEFMAPGMIIGITYIMAVGLTAMAVIIEKREGLLDRSWAAGVMAWEVIFSLLFTLFVVMLFQIAFVLICTFLVFKVPCVGSPVWVTIAALIAGLEGMAYGLFVSSLVSDENSAIMIALGSFYPNLLLSGIIWPVEAIPDYLREFSYFLPFTLLANTMRCVLSRGWSIMDNGIWTGYLAGIGWILSMILIASLIFKYKH